MTHPTRWYPPMGLHDPPVSASIPVVFIYSPIVLVEVRGEDLIHHVETHVHIGHAPATTKRYQKSDQSRRNCGGKDKRPSLYKCRVLLCPASGCGRIKWSRRFARKASPGTPLLSPPGPPLPCRHALYWAHRAAAAVACHSLVEVHPVAHDVVGPHTVDQIVLDHGAGAAALPSLTPVGVRDGTTKTEDIGGRAFRWEERGRCEEGSRPSLHRS
jgi:hypothetical protein